jgi:hypothetical protein
VGERWGGYYLGTKLRLVTDRASRTDLAVRTIARPSTGAIPRAERPGPDVLSDVIVTKATSRRFDVSARLGCEYLSAYQDSGVSRFVPVGGVGLVTTGESPLHVHAAISTDVVPPAIRALPPDVRSKRLATRVTSGLILQNRHGVFVDAGFSWELPSQARDLAHAADIAPGDAWDVQFRVGFHPGAGTARR